MIDLDAYFARIGYHGERAPTLTTLHALCEAHVLTIPFENLDVLLGRRIDLAPAAVDAKLITGGRGGYCFEHNSLFQRVLETLGFTARLISARVRIGRPRDLVPARTHVFLRVEIDGESWLADVGVGGLAPTSALRFVADVEQATPHEARRIVREEGRWFHQARLAEGKWHDICEFTGEEMPPIDCEVANWYTSAHPASHLKNRLLVARALPDGRRVTVVNNELTLRGRDGAGDSRLIESPDEMLAILERHFDLRFPAGTVFNYPAP
jgi:N-hydroxyarylamine O-acetyltransferase